MPRIVGLLLCLLIAPASLAQDVIHYWSFNSAPAEPWPSPIAADIGSGALTHTYDPATLQNFAGTTVNAYDGAPAGGSFSVQLGTDLVNVGESFYLDVPTSGFDNIVFSYATRGTSTGFTTHDIAYSTDGTNFVHAATITGRTSTTFTPQTVDLAGIAGVGDNGDLRLRITLTGGTGSSGNNRFDNIRVDGSPTGSNQSPAFTSVLTSGDVPYEEEFSFTYQAADPDGDPLTFSLVDAPAGASLNVMSGLFTWTPAAADEGQSFDVVVEVSDGSVSVQTSAVLTVIEPPEGGVVADLFFSEYVEGSSNNKALEIFNGTDGPADLSAYAIQIYFNGNTSPGSTISLSGTLAPGGVFVVAHSSSAPALFAAADLTTGSLTFNGDDAVVLRRGTAVVDAIGRIGELAIWGSGETRTQNQTLRRPGNSCSGRTDPFSPYDPAEYFAGYPQDTFDGIGSHTANCTVLPPNFAPEFLAVLPDTMLDAGDGLAFTYVAADGDGDELTFRLLSAPAGATLDATTGAFSWTAAGTGIFGIYVSVSDGRDSSVVVSAAGVQGEVCPTLEGAALRECIRTGYTPARVLGYDTARDTFYSTIDLEPDGFVRGIYTGFAVEFVGPGNPRQIMGAGGINAEHVWPQSKGAGEEPARSDMHHLYPARDAVNSSRSNFPYSNIAPENATSWWRLGDRYFDIPADDLGTYSRSAPGTFEPRDRAKGPIARSALYFFSIYEDRADEAFLLVQKETLAGWHEDRRPAGWEVRRTFAISRHQGNINPYLLDPTLAARMVVDIVVPDPVTIAEARAEADGVTVTIEGVVTRSGGRFARLQDETAGLTVFESGGGFRAAVEAGDVAPGDLIRVYGAMNSFNGLRQITPSIFEVISRGNELPEPEVVTLAEIAANGEAYESELILVRALQIDAGGDVDFASAKTYSISDATVAFGVVDFRTPAFGEGAINGEPIPGGLFDFVGVLGQFISTYQLQPIDAGDVRPDVQPPVITVVDQPIRLWKPNGQLKTFVVSDLVVSIDDGPYGPLAVESAFIQRVTSDELPLDQPADVFVRDGCSVVDLRVQRRGEGDGRVYTVEVAAYDVSGNLGVASVEVHVPHNVQPGAVAVDSGVAYEVVPECGSAGKMGGIAFAAEEAAIPDAFHLAGNYPNPFNPTTTIRFDLPETAVVRLEVFDVLGRQVLSIPPQSMDAGAAQSLQVDASMLTSGSYLYRIVAQGGEKTMTATGMMMVVK